MRNIEWIALHGAYAGQHDYDAYDKDIAPTRSRWRAFIREHSPPGGLLRGAVWVREPGMQSDWRFWDFPPGTSLDEAKGAIDNMLRVGEDTGS